MRPKHSKERADFLEKYTELLRAKARRLQDLYYNLMVDDFLLELQTSDGAITQSARNYSLARQITTKHKQFFEKEAKSFAIWMVKRLIDLQKLNEKYFKALVPDKFRTAVAERTNKLRLRALGWQNDKILKGSFLHDLVSNLDVAKAVKRTALRAINSTQNIQQFKNVFRVLIKGVPDTEKAKGTLGLIDKLVYNETADVLIKEDRELQTKYAEELDMKYALFQGPVLTTSRKFCKARKGKVFTFKEIEAWKDLPAWPGRNKDYDPFRDIGGHKCVDALDIISEELAFRLRPELKNAA